MGLPNINITFQEAASTAIVRAQKGVLGMILKDSTTSVQGSHVFKSTGDIPTAMSDVNKDYIKQAFIGNDSKPKKVLCYVLPAAPTDLSAATAWLSSQRFNWLVGPPDTDAAEATELDAWVSTQRAAGRKYKAVLPEKAADDMAVVNFASNGIKVGGTTYAAAGYCARIAGLIAGTPLTAAITYATLPEVTAVEQLTKAEMDAAVEAGKLIAFHDGQKVKCGRGVTSLTTLANTLAEYQKIKIVEAIDLISEDITTLAEDTYIGKYANSYDNKLLLVTAIGNYFRILELEGVLKKGSTVDIDVAATKAYLTDSGVDVTELSEREIRESDTGDNVFLAASITVLDAIEDITLKISI